MGHRLDEIDKRIIYYLTKDARNTSAPIIAREVDMSPGTIRNRIQQLEERGVLKGYHAAVDFEQGDGRLATLFVCTADPTERSALAKLALDVSGVVNVREVRTGKRNLHVKAVGTDTADFDRIERGLVELGLRIEDESLLQAEQFHAYHPFGPDDDPNTHSLTDFMSLAGGAEVAEITVVGTAPVAGKTLREADQEGVLGDDVLVVAIERGDEVITPKGDTPIYEGDIVTVFSRGGISNDLLSIFTDESEQ